MNMNATYEVRLQHIVDFHRNAITHKLLGILVEFSLKYIIKHFNLLLFMQKWLYAINWIEFVKISNSIYRPVNISERGSISRFMDSAILGVWPIALRLFIVHVIIAVMPPKKQFVNKNTTERLSQNLTVVEVIHILAQDCSNCNHSTCLVHVIQYQILNRNI